MPVFTAKDAKREGFDLTMEALCSLPREPVFASLSDLSFDLGLVQKHEALTLIARAQDKGIKVQWRDGSVSVRAASWLHARTLSEAYWDSLYD